jgi:hypothetical protein
MCCICAQVLELLAPRGDIEGVCGFFCDFGTWKDQKGKRGFNVTKWIKSFGNRTLYRPSLVIRRGMRNYASSAQTGGVRRFSRQIGGFVGKIRGVIRRFLDAHPPPGLLGTDGKGMVTREEALTNGTESKSAEARPSPS